MRVTFLCVGKIKERYLLDGIKEYRKRLCRYCKLDICEVSDEHTPDKAGDKINEQIRKKESDRLYRYIKEDAYVIALAIEGRQMDSIAFSKKMQTLGIQGTSHLQFVIGGSLGLHNDILKRADFNISFSKLTFPHQMMRLILLEQIYRGYRIMEGEPYHK